MYVCRLRTVKTSVLVLYFEESLTKEKRARKALCFPRFPPPEKRLHSRRPIWKFATTATTAFQNFSPSSFRYLLPPYNLFMYLIDRIFCTVGTKKRYAQNIWITVLIKLISVNKYVYSSQPSFTQVCLFFWVKFSTIFTTLRRIPKTWTPPGKTWTTYYDEYLSSWQLVSYISLI